MAILLVAVYHIWVGSVSGGVDIFLLLTGFLITGSLVRGVERNGAVRFAPFLSRLVKRLFPAAAIAMGGVLVATLLWMPRSRWSDVLSDTVASALYYENWRLSVNAVDYLAQNNAASPLQHFWSLSIQGQFYLVWPVLIALSAVAASRAGIRFRRAVLAAVGTAFVLSFAYSVYITHADQRWAYFDGGARVWELALGGILALVLPTIDLPRRLRIALGWIGLIALCLVGLAPIGAMFPGYVALWPVGAGALVLLAGRTGSRFGADRILGWGPLSTVGDHAYAFYLWHWPVLVFYLEVTDRVRPSITGGLLVLLVSAVLAAATKKIAEDGVQWFTRARTAPLWSVAAGAAFLVPVLVATAVWTVHMDRQTQLREELASDQGSYPGAAVAAAPALAEGLRELPLLPDTAVAKEASLDATLPCHSAIADTELSTCAFGPEDAERTVALVGSSHGIHWLGALRTLAEENGWRVITLTKDVCQFSAEVQLRDDGDAYPECETWKREQARVLEELGPDAVFTTSTQTRYETEELPRGYAERWREMDALGIEVIGVRDTPRFDFLVPECVDESGRDGCTSPASDTFAGTDPAKQAQDAGELPDNVHLLDITDVLCPEGVCVPVMGNRLAYYDNSHFTYAFSESLAPVLGPRLKEATGW